MEMLVPFESVHEITDVRVIRIVTQKSFRKLVRTGLMRMLVDSGCFIQMQLLDCVTQREKLPDKCSVSKQRLGIEMFVEVSVPSLHNVCRRNTM